MLECNPMFLCALESVDQSSSATICLFFQVSSCTVVCPFMLSSGVTG